MRKFAGNWSGTETLNFVYAGHPIGSLEQLWTPTQSNASDYQGNQLSYKCRY